MASSKSGIIKFLKSKKFLGGLVIFIAGFASFGGMNSFFAYTNEMEFCTSCHSMQINLEEYKETIHYKNASGVQAICSDCHVPKSFFPKLKAKIVAVKDIYHEVMGTVDTKEKFEERRWQMAVAVWDKMRASNSRECRSCHDFENMDFSAQGRSARKKHPRAQAEGKSCIQCHKGIAHYEPWPPEGWVDPDAEEEEDDEEEDDKSN